MHARKNLHRRIWTALAAIFVIEAVGLLVIAPSWRGGSIRGSVNALAMMFVGAALAFLLLAITRSGNGIWTRASRYLFAVAGGFAADVVLTWGLWAAGFPIENGTVRRGLMPENYWLGPAMLAYAVVVWVVYRSSLSREDQQAPPVRSAR
ncbi:hypothetical protein [Paraburkholderia sp. J8-2]|uniref:hypothetical protein n=1 Tax=Paraburkholderia sp. J8-2 TaxID=2805440 RepID=UPI002AB7881B|nr:hypothetical protein [Paraburkholderia sp. J8-2]